MLSVVNASMDSLAHARPYCYRLAFEAFGFLPLTRNTNDLPHLHPMQNLTEVRQNRHFLDIVDVHTVR